MANIWERAKNALNVFVRDENRRNSEGYGDSGRSYGARPDRRRTFSSTERTFIAAVYVRLAVDTSTAKIRHVRLDDEDRFQEVIRSGLHRCLNVEANIDQAATHFRRDVAMSMFENGVIAIVPTNYRLSNGGLEIVTLRVGRVVQWFPEHVMVDLYDDRDGLHKQIKIEKTQAAIIENPLYSVMNEPNSTLQRLARKLAYLDEMDAKVAAGKIDLIMQLPYSLKGETRKQQAQQRQQELEAQLEGSTHGVGYIDATEKITQLNRPAENNLLRQIEYLEAKAYAELGVTPEVMNGTADEATMLNYNNRTVEPILVAITEALARVFLTQTAQTQGQTFEYFVDPFKLIPLSQIAEIGDKLTRNAIVSSNEMRGFIGLPPVKDPEADKLSNKNLPEQDKPGNEQKAVEPPKAEQPEDIGELTPVKK